MCLGKSKDEKQRFSKKNKERFSAAIFTQYGEKYSPYLPDGICKSCETVLGSQSKPNRMKIKYQINYTKLAKHVQFLTQYHPEDGENGNILSKYQN